MSKELAAIVWTLVVLAGVALLGVVAWFARRWLNDQTAAQESPAFTLQDLREMRENGSLSETEYHRMRSGILSSFRSERPADPDESAAGTDE